MLPGMTLPGSLAALLGALRPCFTAPGFVTFCGLAAGLAGQMRRRTVVGMLVGAALQHTWPHDRAHYFFARARWELDQLGLAVARLAVLMLTEPGADLRVAVDDPVFRRSAGTRTTAITQPASATAAPPSPGTAPRPSPPSRTWSSSCAGR